MSSTNQNKRNKGFQQRLKLIRVRQELLQRGYNIRDIQQIEKQKYKNLYIEIEKNLSLHRKSKITTPESIRAAKCKPMYLNTNPKYKDFVKFERLKHEGNVDELIRMERERLFVDPLEPFLDF